jgi:hypothetical protein
MKMGVVQKIIQIHSMIQHLWMVMDILCTANDIGHGYESCGHLVDNQSVVLYNPFLFWKYGCQINIEVCDSCNQIYSLEYIFK